MTEIMLYLKDDKVCYEPAQSQRDQSANFAILLPSLRQLHPVKHLHLCEDIGSDRVVVKYYQSNRGVPYLSIYAVENGALVLKYAVRGQLNTFAIAAVLEKLGVPKDRIDVVLTMLGLG